MKLKKALSGFLALVMVLSLVSLPATAAEEQENLLPNTETSTVVPNENVVDAPVEETVEVPDEGTVEEMDAPAANTLHEGLVLYSSFDDESAKDLTEHGHDGTTVGSVTFVTGADGKAIQLPTTVGSYVKYGKSADTIPGTKDFSLSIWYKATGDTNNGTLISNKNYNDGSYRGIAVGTYDNSSIKDVRVNFAATGAVSSAGTRVELKGSSHAGLKTPQDGSWHHLVVSYDRDGNMTGYVDGALVGALSIAGQPGTIDVGLDLVLGADGQYGNGLKNAAVDEFYVYSRVLTANEIVALANKEKPDLTKVEPEPDPEPEPPFTPDSNLILYSSFDAADVNGTTIADKSENSHNGTLKGTTSTVSFTPGISGNAIQFGSTKGGYVDYGKSAGIIPATEDFSVSMWFKRDGNNNDCTVLATKDWNSGDNTGMVVGAFTGDLRINMSDTQKKRVELAGLSSADNIGPLRTVQNGDWHHLAAVYDRAGDLSVYVDGVLAGSKAITGYPATIDAGLNLMLGADGKGAYPLQNSRVDELRIYSKALSAEEVTTVYDLNATPIKLSRIKSEMQDILAQLTAMTPGLLFTQQSIDGMKTKCSTAIAAVTNESTVSEAQAVLDELKTNYQTFCAGSIAPTASFHLASDIHVSAVGDSNYNDYVAALKNMKTVNDDSTIAFVNGGDFTNNSGSAEYAAFYKATKENNPVTPERTLILLGNHDVRGSSGGEGNPNWNKDPNQPDKCVYWNTAKELYKTNNAPYMPAEAQNTLYHSKVLGGYTFIMLNTELGLKDAMYMSPAQLTWFEAEMKKAYEANSEKPIFIIAHQALNDTHWMSNVLDGFDGVKTDGSGQSYQTGADAKVKEIMAKYPSGVFMSGHIHNNFGMAEVVLREYGITVDIPSMSDPCIGLMDKGTGYEVEIFDGYLAFRAYNYLSGEWMPKYDVIVSTGEDSPAATAQRAEVILSDELNYSVEDVKKVKAAASPLLELLNRTYNQSGLGWSNSNPPSEYLYHADTHKAIEEAIPAVDPSLVGIEKLPEPRPEPPNPYEVLQQAWRAYLLGGDGTDLDTTVPAVANYVEGLEADATKYWNNLIRSNQPRASFIFPDVDMTQDGSTDRSANIVTTLSRLRTLAFAWATEGTSYYQNDYVKEEIISATDYVVNNYYYANGKYTTSNKAPGNWYHWDISSSTNLGNIAMVMYDVLGAERVQNYAKAIQWYAPACQVGGPHSKQTGAMTGGNLLLKANAVAQAGILLKDSSMLNNVSTKVKGTANTYNDPDMLFSTGNPGDGFYADGSYIQHQALPYIAGYGTDLYNNFSIFSTLLKGSDWEISFGADEDPVIYDFVFSGVEPFIYKNHTMDLVTGRAIVRKGYSDVGKTASIIAALVPMRGSFPTQEQNQRFDSMLKYYLSLDPERYLNSMGSIYSIQMASELLNDVSIQPRSDYALTKTFAMDRTVHLNEDFGLGIAMQSTRTFAHELITTSDEGKRTWNIANGMVFLYDADEDQYNGGYWCSIDPTRLPGTTTEHVVYGNGKGSLNTNIYDWTGGSSIGNNGVAGMYMKALSRNDNTNAYSTGPRTGADMKKSYFMFGDRILMMGSSITSNTGDHVETIVDNRKIKPDGSNVITVDGQKADLNASAQALENPSWLHIQGNVAGSEIGYYFPQDVTVQALKETRTGNWIDQGGDSGTATDTYATFYVDHGVKPTDAGYVYVLLPGKTTAETAAYAKSPDVEILRQDGSVHAARDNKQNITAANFWKADTVAGITVSAPASVTVKVEGDIMTIGVSDPTQRDVPIDLTMAVAGELVSADARITADESAPFIKFSVDTTEGLGGTYTATFKLTKSEQLELVSTTTTAKDIVVAPYTPFVELNLPTSGLFVATDMAQHTLPILWAREDYNPNAYGTYTLVGTPILPPNMRNSSNLTLEAKVTVVDQKIAESDTYVQDGTTAGTVMSATGTSFPIKMDASGYYRKGIIRIDLTGIPADVAKVDFAVTINVDAGFKGGALYQVGNEWDQKTVTWNTLPARTSETPLATFTKSSPDENNVLRLDVTSAVKAAITAGQTKISFVMEATGGKDSKNQATVYSIESTAGQKPALSYTRTLEQDTASADKTNLTWLVALVDTVAQDKADFVLWDEAGFAAALAAAELVLEDGDATKSAVNSAEDALLVRLLSLRVKVRPQS